MDILEQHLSPDGLLKLIVCGTVDGEISIGFEGYQWHTHADLLTSVYGSPQELAVRRFVDDVLTGRAIIVVARVNNDIRDIWITEDAEAENEYTTPGETLEMRSWER